MYLLAFELRPSAEVQRIRPLPPTLGAGDSPQGAAHGSRYNAILSV